MREGASSGPPRDRHRRRRRRPDRPATARVIVPEPTTLAAAPTPAPLTPAEVAELKEHFAFLRSYREVLRLKLNAQEDLLVNGQREPGDRGVCRHLLGKVDRVVVEQALAREPMRSDATARVRMLAGVIRLTGDISLLLSWLEALAQLPQKRDAAAAFAGVVRRIDFTHLAPSKLARLLQVLVDTFADHERVQVIFSLLGLPGFCEAFDAGVASLDDPVARLCAPLRAVHAKLTGHDTPASAEQLVAGVELVLSGPDGVLRGYGERLREELVALALQPAVPVDLADRALKVLLPSLPTAGRGYARLAVLRASRCLGRHADDEARHTLESLRRAQPDHRIAARWLEALALPRLGRVALRAEANVAGKLTRGFWLDGQLGVWVRTAAASEGPRMEAAVAVHATLALPGVAPVVEHGVTGGVPYVAVLADGRPLLAADVDGLGDRERIELLAVVSRVLRALAFAGARIVDVEPERFLYDDRSGGVVLANLDGVGRAAPDAAEHAHLGLVAGLARRLFPHGIGAIVSPEAAALWNRLLATPADLLGLIRVIDRVVLAAGVPSRARR